MKKFKSILYMMVLSGVVLFSSSCNKDNSLTSFSFDFDAGAGTFTIPPVHQKGKADLATVTTKNSLDSIKKANNAGAFNVKSIYIKSVYLQLNTPVGTNFNVLDTIILYVSAPGLNEQKMVSINSIPKGNANLKIPINSTVNLVDYLKKDYISIRGEVYTNDSIPHPTTFTVTPKYTLTTE